jgi:uncharacterized oxidoreductase
MPILSAEQLRSLTKSILVKKGATEPNGQKVAELLVRADLTGHDSHGVARVPAYVNRIDQGAVDPQATGHLEMDAAAVGLYDAQRAFGQVAGTAAMNIAIEKARTHGIAGVGIRNCAHLGRMADYCLIAVEQQMIGITMATSARAVAPFGGTEPMFNPSPFGVGIPAGQQSPFVLDISMGTCAISKIDQLHAKGAKLPDGWIIDKDGNPSNEPDDFYSGGAILPLGGDVGYKGYGLAFMIDILGGALTGAGCSAFTDFRGGNGAFMIVIDIARFKPLATFRQSIDQLIEKLKSSRTMPGVSEVMIPGEAGFQAEQKQLRDGIPLADATWRALADLSGKLGVSLPGPIG